MYRLLQNTTSRLPSKMTSPSDRLLMAASSSRLGGAGSGSMARSAESVMWRIPCTRSCSAPAMRSRALEAKLVNRRLEMPGFPAGSLEFAQQNVNILELRGNWLAGVARHLASVTAYPGASDPVHQDHPDIVDVGRASGRSAADRRSRRRRRWRRCCRDRLSDRGRATSSSQRCVASIIAPAGSAGAAGAAVGAVGIAGQRRNARGVLEQAGQRQRIFLVGAAAPVAAHGHGEFAAREDRDAACLRRAPSAPAGRDRRRHRGPRLRGRRRDR